MSLKIGIVGLPNVGKSTIFNAITNSQVEAANYPFATIEPNVGVVVVKEILLQKLADIFQSKKIIYNNIQFVDIAGLVKGASKGEGLGNKFLSNIREVDLVLHIVRLFDDENIIHINSSINPQNDIEIVDMEFIFSDIDQSQRWLDKNQRKIELTGNTQQQQELKWMLMANETLKKGDKISTIANMNDKQIKFYKMFMFLTFKPTIYCGNISENNLKNYTSTELYESFISYLDKMNDQTVVLSAQIEYEISKLDDDERKEFLNDLELESSGIDTITTSAYKKLHMISFYTIGPKEAHAWSCKQGTLAPEAAGIIHTDFEKGFIKAEIYKAQDLLIHKTEQLLREKGLIKLEGKDYIIKDGDVCHFRYNV